MLYFGGMFAMSDVMKISLSQSLENKFFNNQIWTVQQVASYLHCSVGHVYNLVNKKRIPYRKLGRLLRFFSHEIMEWVERGEIL